MTTETGETPYAGSAPSTKNAVLCRYSEIFLKGGNRGFFEHKLAANIRRATSRLGGRVERLHGRILYWPPPGGESRALAALQKVFGLVSLSAVRIVEKDIKLIGDAAVEEVGIALEQQPGWRPRFKVDTRRSDKRFQPSSPLASAEVGGRIIDAHGLGVDLHTPELVVGVEIGFEHAFVYARVLPGPGGLPVGSSGEVDLLLSGGIDSPVAGWMAMKRGCHIAATYFHSFPYTGDKTKDKVARLASRIASWQGEVELRVVPFTDAQKALRDAGDPRLAVVLYRRMMMRVAERIARSRGALALVTGEALAQVASQTLENMTVIEEACGLPILRPLIAHDKQETITVARRIDTFELSIEPYEDCCSLFAPDHPATKARLADVLEAESKVDIAALVEACIAGVEIIRCKTG